MANAFISGRRYPYGTTIVPKANSSFYSFVANSATNAHLVDGKEISEWTAGTVWTCTYNNGVITLPEGKKLNQGNIQPIQFIAPTASNNLTTLTINSQSYTIKMQDGSEVPENLWAANSVVFAVVSEDQKTINFKSGGGLSLDALTNPAAATDILKNKQAYDDNGNLLTGTILSASGEQGTVTGINIESISDHTVYGNITSNGIYKISLTPKLSRYVDNTAIWPTYINTNVSVNIPTGSQKFTSSSTFTAPYTTNYFVVVYPGHGRGGSGGEGYEHDVLYKDSKATPGGGGGGSAYLSTQPAIAIVHLNANDSVPVTVNSSLTSFGSYCSISTGTNGGNGGDATETRAGTGGSGGSKPIDSYSGCVAFLTPSFPTVSLSGTDGKTGGGILSTQVGWQQLGGSGGGHASYGVAGGAGTNGESVFNDETHGYASSLGSVVSTQDTYCVAETGCVLVIYGGNY